MTDTPKLDRDCVSWSRALKEAAKARATANDESLSRYIRRLVRADLGWDARARKNLTREEELER